MAEDHTSHRDHLSQAVLLDLLLWSLGTALNSFVLEEKLSWMDILALHVVLEIALLSGHLKCEDYFFIVNSVRSDAYAALAYSIQSFNL